MLAKVVVVEAVVEARVKSDGGSSAVGQGGGGGGSQGEE